MFDTCVWCGGGGWQLISMVGVDGEITIIKHLLKSHKYLRLVFIFFQEKFKKEFKRKKNKCYLSCCGCQSSDLGKRHVDVVSLEIFTVQSESGFFGQPPQKSLNEFVEVITLLVEIVWKVGKKVSMHF